MILLREIKFFYRTHVKTVAENHSPQL